MVQYFVFPFSFACVNTSSYMASFQINFSKNSHLSAESCDVSGIQTQLEEELRKLKRSTNLRRKCVKKLVLLVVQQLYGLYPGINVRSGWRVTLMCA